MTETMPEHLSWILWTQQEDLLLHFFFPVQTLVSWQSPRTRWHLREFSESGNFECPTAQCGSGHDT